MVHNTMEDMTILESLNMHTVVSELAIRFANQKPYTMCADICISVNPFKWFDTMYNEATTRRYKNKNDTKAHYLQIYSRIHSRLVLLSTMLKDDLK